MRRSNGGLLAALILGLSAAGPAAAVTILDSTYDEQGYKLAEWTAAQPQFKATFALCENDYCGGGSATWIGNDDAHGYLITAAHEFVDQGYTATSFTYRASNGKMYKGESVAVHPYYKPNEKNGFRRMGFDIAIVKLTAPVEGVGPAPTLSTQTRFDSLIFMGFGARGKASTGEDESIAHGDVAAAAEGLVTRHSVEDTPIAEGDADNENFAQIPLFKEDGSMPCPEGHNCVQETPSDKTDGAIGAGDSGGGAWDEVTIAEGKTEWQLAGVNVVGQGHGKYGTLSIFAMLIGARPWIMEQFPGAKFWDDK